MILIEGPVYAMTGYGEVVRNLIKVLHNKAELSIRDIPTKQKVEFLDPTFVNLLQQLQTNRGRIDIHIKTYPPNTFTKGKSVLSGDRITNIGFTMFEGTPLPNGWIEICNQLAETWVPSQYCANLFSGVRRLRIIPLGIDPIIFNYNVKPMKIRGAKGFTFLSIFDLIDRKGFRELIRAYITEFTAEDDVTLLLKVSSAEGASKLRSTVNDELKRYPDRGKPNLIALTNSYPSYQLASIYKTADAFVLPTKGEGFCLPALEAMAVGIPVIITNHGGHLDFCNKSNSHLIDVTSYSQLRVQDSPHDLYRGVKFANPDIGHLQQLMRTVYEGTSLPLREISTQITEKWSWNKMGDVVMERVAQLERHRSRAVIPSQPTVRLNKTSKSVKKGATRKLAEKNISPPINMIESRVWSKDKPRVSIGMIVCNESEYIEYALTSIYDWDCCFDISIVEGAVELYKLANTNGSSIDDTVNIIKRFPDPDNKIMLKQGQWKNKAQMRQVCYRMTKGDYYLIVDADEIYKKEDLENIKQAIITNPKAVVFGFPHVHFWRDFQTITVGSCWDTIHPRLFRKIPNLDYNVQHPQGHTSLFDGKEFLVPYKSSYETVPINAVCYHYGYVKQPSLIKAKEDFYEARRGKEDRCWLTWKPGQPTKHKGKAVTFNGQHPNVMLKHPYRSRSPIKESEQPIQTQVSIVTPSEGVVPVSPPYNNILFPIQNVSHYSGGRYYLWFLIYALAANGINVTVVSNDLNPPFKQDFTLYSEYETNITFVKDRRLDGKVLTESAMQHFINDLAELGSFDAVVGSPRSAGHVAAEYSMRFGIPVYNAIFETPNYIREYRGGKDSTDEYWEDYRNTLMNTSCIIPLSKLGVQKVKEWLPGHRGQVEYIYPCINDIVADKIRKDRPGSSIVFISRCVDHKNLNVLISGLSMMRFKGKLDIIGAGASHFVRVASNNSIRARGYENIPDLEKFSVLKTSLGSANPSNFEGFGISPAEALYCGRPIVVVDLPVYREAYEDTLCYVPYDRHTDANEWMKKLVALQGGLLSHSVQQGKQLVSKRYRFSNLVSRVKYLFRGT